MSTEFTRPFVIVGGGLAAAEAAKTLRSEGFDDEIVIVNGEPMLPYERPPLTKEYLRGEAGPEKLLAQPWSFYEEAGIDVRTGVRATRIDIAARSVELDDGTNVVFDRLLVTTGARASRAGIEGTDAPWVHFVRTAADADRLRVAARQSSSAVVAGGGWIAAETAASLRQMGLQVTLVVPGSEVLERHIGPEAGAEFTALHERNGVRIVRSARVAGVRRTGGRPQVVLTSGETVQGDLAVLGLGASPNDELARGAGLEVGDGILVDERLETSAVGVFAAGDVAAAWSPRYGQRVRSEHWDNARRQARTAARNMLGRDEVYDRVPYFFSDQFDLGMELLGRPSIASAQLVRREDTGLIVVWTRNGSVVAGMHTNLWDSKKPLDRLIASGAALDPHAFADPSIPFAELAPIAA